MTMSPDYDPIDAAGAPVPAADGDQLMVDDGPQIEANDAKDSYYYGLVQNDMIGLLRPLLARRGYHVRWGDGRLEAEYVQAPETPWHYVKLAKGLDCYLWHSVFHQIIGRATRRDYVPTPCLSCFKVVVRPKTVAGLFSLMKLQHDFPFPCKCGIELRTYTSGAYGGYHYAQGLDEGLWMYEYVRKAVDAAEDLGPETSVILKRGCTEYERAAGPSENWTSTPEQQVLERRVEQTIAHVPNIQPMPAHMVAHVHRKWIEHAAQIGDETYKKFTGGLPLSRPVTTYHHLADPSNLPKQLEDGRWSYKGEMYTAETLPDEAKRNAKLRQTGAEWPHQR